MALLDIKNLNFAYPNAEYKALSNINLQIDEGSFTLICGQSGCGKSTLLSHMKKELTPKGDCSGSVYFNGVDLKELDLRTSATDIGFVMQNIENQIVTDKVYSELAFGLESLGLKSDVIHKRIAEMASFLGIHNWFRSETFKLSGGQKQMLNLASIIVMQPKLLILDEPTSQLDPIAASEFLSTLVKINADLGITIVITEHRMEEIFSYCDRVVVMDSGQIIEASKPKDIVHRLALSNSIHNISEGFPSAVRLFAGLKMQGECPLTVKDGRSFVKNYVSNNHIAIKNDGAQEAKNERQTKHNKDDVAVKFDEVFFKYEKNLSDVLKGLSLTINKGEVMCILGGNGSGKTTALSALCGNLKPYYGNIQVFGKRLEKYKAGEMNGKVLSAMPQNPQALFTNKSVKNELTDVTKDENKIAEVIEKLGIKELLNSHPYDLSGGEQQKVAFAKVLLCESEIIILDEPTKGLDSHYKKSFGAFLQNLAKAGKTIILATHDIEFAANYASSCALFFDGNITAHDEAKQFFSNNYFYTTATNRIARAIGSRAVIVDELIEDLKN